MRCPWAGRRTRKQRVERSRGWGHCWLGWGAAICIREWITGKAINSDAVPGLCSESTEKPSSIAQMSEG